MGSETAMERDFAKYFLAPVWHEQNRIYRMVLVARLAMLLRQ